jgi:branched-chain amino acid transport system ATP-binding protein
VSALLEVRHLHVAYGKVEAVHGVSLAIDAARIVTVIGPNGAGKTTLLGAIMGLLPSRGEIRYQGGSLAEVAVEERVARGVCLVPERRELFAAMSVADNLELGAFSRRRRDGPQAIGARREGVYARFPRLAERRRQLAGTLSGGERQMLALGRALMSEPALLMLDEPSLGLAPAVVDQLYDALYRLHEDGLTLLLAEQSIPLALAIADYAYVLQTGRTVLEGTAESLEQNEQVQEIYLGIKAPVPSP